MKNQALQNTNLFFGNLPGRLRRRKWIFPLFVLFMTLVLGIGAGRVVIDESLESYFREDDPVKMAYDTFKSHFGSDEYVYIVYRARDGDIFSHRSLEALQGVHRELTEYRLGLPVDTAHPLDHITEVKSLINVKYLEAHDNNLFSRNFIGNTLPATERERELLRLKGLKHPDYPRRYLSENSEYGGIILRTDFNARRAEIPDSLEDNTGTTVFDTDEDLFDSDPVDDPGTGGQIGNATENPPDHVRMEKSDIKEYTPFVAALKSVLEQEKYSGSLEFHPVGNPILMDFFATAVLQDMGRLMLLLISLIALVLWLLFRSLSAVVWPVVIIVLTIIWVMGIIGWLGVPMSAMIQVIIFLALSVGIADSVHILSGYLFFRNRNLNHEAALTAVMEKSGLACLLTSLTTAIGLMSLVLVPLKPIVFFGIFAAVCVGLAFGFTVFLLPVMLDVWAPVPKQQDRDRDHLILGWIKRIEGVSIQHPGKVIGIFSVVAIFLTYGFLQLRIDSNFVEIIKEGLPLRDTYTLVDRHLGGTTNMEIMLDFKVPDAMKDPDVLVAVQSLQTHLETEHRDKVTLTMSLANVVKDSFKALNNDDPSKYVIPSDPAVLAQVLFLFSNANPDDRRRLVSDNYQRSRIGLNALNVGSVEAMAMMKEVQHFIEQRFAPLKQKYPGLEITLTGNMALLAIMLDYISWSQIKSFSLALGVISIVLFLVLGSWKAGIVSLPPNLFPILASFGLMGFFGVPLDADTLLIAPIIIGLAVDDTIHFMTHFRLEIEKSKDIGTAVVHALREAGQAISFTSLILSAGFLVFLLSFHNGLSHFGIFAAVAVMSALICDLFLLPALCRVFHLDFSNRGQHIHPPRHIHSTD